MDPATQNNNLGPNPVAGKQPVGPTPPASPASPTPPVVPPAPVEPIVEPAPNPEVASPVDAGVTAPGPSVASIPTQNPVPGDPATQNMESAVDDLYATQPQEEPALQPNPPLTPPEPNIMDTGSGEEPKSKKGKLKVLLVALVVLVASAVGGFLYMRSLKTSNEDITKFSSSVTALNSASTKFGLEMSGVASGSSSEDDLKKSVQAYDGAIEGMEKAVGSLKSDVKDLKASANKYLDAVKKYRADEVAMALDLAKISGYIKTINDVDFNSSTGRDATAFGAEVDRVNGVYEKELQSIKEVDVKSDQVKAYRDAFVEYVEEMMGFLTEMKAMVAAGDTSGLMEIQRKANSSESVKKFKDMGEEIKNKLSVDSANAETANKARRELNGEIIKLNSSSR